MQGYESMLDFKLKSGHYTKQKKKSFPKAKRDKLSPETKE
jgi:hypothetical protein